MIVRKNTPLRRRVLWQFGIMIWLCLGGFLRGVEAQLPPGMTRANESRYLTVGRDELNRGHFESACVAFAKAREEDPEDPEAPLGAAMALNPLGRHAEAADAARSALVCWRVARVSNGYRPPIASFEARAEFELGYALYRLQQLPAAIEELERARDLLPTDGRIRFTLGLALYHTGNRDDDAAAEFSRAIDLAPELAESARAMRGLAYRRMGQLELARRDLQEVASLKEDSSLLSTSRPLIEILHRQVSPRPTTGLTWGAMGWYEHDSNLLLTPESGAQTPSERSDNAFALLGTAAWRPEAAPDWVLAYSLFGKIYAKTDELNLIGNLASLSVDLLRGETGNEDLTDPARTGANWTDFTPGPAALKLQVESMYYHLDADPYLWRNAFSGRLEVPFGRFWAGQLTLQMGHKAFQQTLNKRFDGPEYGGRLGWELHDPERTRALILEYHAAMENADAPEFDNLGEDLSLTGRMNFPAGLEVHATALYGWKDYANRDPLLGTTRADRWIALTVGVSKAISEDLRLALEWTHSDQDSNVNAYGYERDLVILSAWLRF